MKTKLITLCGMNCAICLGYVQERDMCDGCLSTKGKCTKKCTIPFMYSPEREGVFRFNFFRAKDSGSPTPATGKII